MFEKFQTTTGRKTQAQTDFLCQYQHLYTGKWEFDKFGHLIALTGMSAKQLNKWFWDRKKKGDDSIKAKKMFYPGLIFKVYNTKLDKDLTPLFPTLFQRVKIFSL